MRFYDTSQLPANLMRRSFTANLMRIAPNGTAPLLALSGMARVKKLSAVAHSYWVKRALFPQFVTTGTHAAAATTFNVVSTDGLIEGRILIAFNLAAGTFTAPELIRVVSVASGTTFTAVRGVGGTSPQTSLAAGTILLETGSMHEEGSARPTARSVTMEEHLNYMQIFRDSWDVTETLAATAMEPNVEIKAENKEDAAWFHANAIEWSTLFSRRSATTINGRPARTMDGIESIVLQYAPNNVHSANTTTTMAQLEAMLHPTLDYAVNGRAGNRKTLFVGAKAMEVINDIGRKSGLYSLVDNSTNFGMTFKTFQTSRGTWELIEHPLLNANPTTRQMAIVTDLAGFDFQWLRPTHHKDIAFDGTDATSGVFTSECTIEVTNPLGWGIIYNLTAGAI